MSIIRKFANDKKEEQPRAVNKSKMKHFYNVLFEFVNRVVLPIKKKRCQENFMDLVHMELLDLGKQIN